MLDCTLSPRDRSRCSSKAIERKGIKNSWVDIGGEVVVRGQKFQNERLAYRHKQTCR